MKYNEFKNTLATLNNKGVTIALAECNLVGRAHNKKDELALTDETGHAIARSDLEEFLKDTYGVKSPSVWVSERLKVARTFAPNASGKVDDIFTGGKTLSHYVKVAQKCGTREKVLERFESDEFAHDFKNLPIKPFLAKYFSSNKADNKKTESSAESDEPAKIENVDTEKSDASKLAKVAEYLKDIAVKTRDNDILADVDAIANILGIVIKSEVKKSA